MPCILSGEVLGYGRELTAERLRAHWRQLNRAGRGKYVRYSDVAYGILADVVESAMGRPLHECLQVLNGLLGTRLALGVPQDPDFIRVSGLPGKHTDESIRPFNSGYWYGLRTPWGAVTGAPDDAVRLISAFAAESPVLSAELQRLAVTDPDAGILAGERPGADDHMGVGPYATIEWEQCSWGLGVEIRGSKFRIGLPRGKRRFIRSWRRERDFGVARSGHGPDLGITVPAPATRGGFSAMAHSSVKPFFTAPPKHPEAEMPASVERARDASGISENHHA